MEYNKKSIWKWIVIYVVIGGIAYGLVYYLFFNKTQNQIYSTNNNINNNQPMETSKNDPLKIEILEQGSGEIAKNGDKVTVNYLGTLENGTKFDSSYDRNQPFTFQLGAGQVIKGWDLGVFGMKVGEKRRLTIGSELGYGQDGAGNIIPPNATLIFEVELLKIN